MINFAGKKRVYLDMDVLKANNAEKLFRLFAHHHMQIVLYVQSIEDKEQAKQCKAYPYLSYVLCEHEHELSEILEDLVFTRPLDVKKCVSIQGDPCYWMMNLQQVNAIPEYGSVERFIRKKIWYDNTLLAILTLIVASSIGFMIFLCIYQDVASIQSITGIIFALTLILLCYLVGVFRGVCTIGQPLLEFLLEFRDWLVERKDHHD